VIAGDPLRGASLWRACARGERAVSLRASGEAVDRGLVTIVGARLRSAATAPTGWGPWGGAGVFRAGPGALSSPTLAWRAGDGLDGVLVGEALGVAVRAGAAELRLTLVVDGDELTRALTVTVTDAPEGVWWGRAAAVADAAVMMARATARGRAYARAGDGRVWSGPRASAQWGRAVAAGRAATWWAHDADEARWVVRAEGDGAGLRATVACAAEAELAGWCEGMGEGMGEAPTVTRSSPWVDFAEAVG
jgi:hypothetical protein